MDEDGAGLTVAQMSAVVGMSADTLRYYEREKLIRPVARTSGNQRRYSTADVEWVRLLLRLRATGMPVAEMREYARLRALGPATASQRLGLLLTHQERLHRQIAQLEEHDAALTAKIAVYQDAVIATHQNHRAGEEDTDHE